jgi:hypothetical protein
MMATKNGKADSAKAAPSTTKSFKQPKSGSVLAEFLKGIQHVPVMFVNPGWETNTDADTWTVVLPIEGLYVPVKTGLKGFVPKADLRQMAQALLSNPKRAQEFIVDMPQVTDANAAKQIAMLIPLLG